jgi:hypothetical protein
MGAWIDHRPKTAIVTYAAMDAASVYLAHKFIGKKHPKLARVALYSVAAVRFGLAVRNTRMYNEGHAR